MFCPEDAAPVIKSYSPELIVHPLLLVGYVASYIAGNTVMRTLIQSYFPSPGRSASTEVVESITAWFPRLHSLIIGPGLGRDPGVLSCIKKIITAAKEMQKNIVIDAVSVCYNEI